MASESVIALRRQQLGLNQSALGRKVGMSQAAISRIEAGPLDTPDARLAPISEVLGVPLEVLKAHPLVNTSDVTWLHRRRASTMTVAMANRIEATAQLSRAGVEHLCAAAGGAPDVLITRLGTTEGIDPVHAATLVRNAWSLPDGPIINLTAHVEGTGIIVMRRDLGSPGQDAMSTWPLSGNRPPMVIVDSSLSPDRYRFTLAHELGHLLLHPVPTDDQEVEANAFASALLMPAEQIHPWLDGLTPGAMRKLVDLKQTWGVSIAALVRRARDLGELTDRQYREFQVQLGKLGWRRSEPGIVAVEAPRSVSHLIDRCRAEGMSDRDIAGLAMVGLDEFAQTWGSEPTVGRVGA